MIAERTEIEIKRMFAGIPYNLDESVPKMVLAGIKNSCVKQILAISSIYSVFSILKNAGITKDWEPINMAHRRFKKGNSDVHSYLNVWESFLIEFKKGYARPWCTKNYLNYDALKKAYDLNACLTKILKKAGIKISSIPNIAVLEKSVIQGLRNNLAIYDDKVKGYRLCLRPGKIFQIHPSSTLYKRKKDGKKPPKMIVVRCINKTSKLFGKDCMPLNPEDLQEIFTEDKVRFEKSKRTEGQSRSSHNNTASSYIFINKRRIGSHVVKTPPVKIKKQDFSELQSRFAAVQLS